MGFLIGLNGRIGRGKWWLGHNLNIIMLVAFVWASGLSFDMTLGLPAFRVEKWPILCFGLLATTTVNVSICVKRYHDRGKSGAWYFIGAIPFIGALWQFVELGFLRGQAGPNKYDGDEGAARSWGPDFGPNSGYASFEDIDAKISAMKLGTAQPPSATPDTSPVTRTNARLPQGPQGFGRRSKL